jgi:2-hydroxy-3-keto-5-methylthiopentenyl-1-phosphate phosphatase
MDLYIQRILSLHGLELVPVFANHMIINKNHSIRVEFPYYHQGCGVCANCKGMHIRQHRLPGETSVYVGDGFSDLCAVKEADILFAKKDLRHYCECHEIPFIPFQTFSEVRQKLGSFLF